MSLGSSLSCPLKFVLQLVHLSKFCKNCSGRILKKRAVGKHLVVLKMSSFQASFSHRKKKLHDNDEIEEFFLRGTMANGSMISRLYALTTICNTASCCNCTIFHFLCGATTSFFILPSLLLFVRYRNCCFNIVFTFTFTTKKILFLFFFL